MSAYGVRRPSALQLQDGQGSSATQEDVSIHLVEQPANPLSRRLPFAPSTPMFFSHSQDSETDSPNPYEEKLHNRSSVSPNLGSHDPRVSISGTAGLREKGPAGQDWQEEDDEDAYAPNGRRPSRLHGSLSGNSHYLPLNKQALLASEDGDASRNFLSRIYRNLFCRRLPLAFVLPALLLGAILMSLYDSRSRLSTTTLQSQTSTSPAQSQGYLPESNQPLEFHSNGHVYLKESALHSGTASHPILDLIQNATEQWVSLLALLDTT